MSCFVVSDKHINTILNYASKHWTSRIHTDRKSYDSSNLVTIQKLAEELKAENEFAWSLRYKEDLTFDPILYRWEKPVSAAQIVKLCQCYQYQLAEFDEYKDTEAFQVVDYIKRLAVSNIPEVEAAAWEI